MSNSFQYAAIIDHEHLDNGLFLKNLAESVSAQQYVRGIFLHGDSNYTDRIMQTGVMREDAMQRSIKDLNRRLVALMADNGVAAIGINAYQKKTAVLNSGNSTLEIDTSLFESLPEHTHLILSNLVFTGSGRHYTPYPLGLLGRSLQSALELDGVFVFRKDERPNIVEQSLAGKYKWDALDHHFKEKHLPDEIENHSIPVYLTNTRQFRYLPDTSKMAYIGI